MTGKIAALNALNRKKTGINGGEPEKMALTAMNRRNSSGNAVEPEK